jgi:ribonuclease D
MEEKSKEETQAAPLWPYTLIDTQAGWDECLALLKDEPRLALDIEANSLHAYREQVCLVQISIPAHDFILDPVADFFIEGLGPLLASADVEKIFHASEYDLILLKREYDWDVHNLFDTMWAARILGYQNMGLAGFLGEFYGVEMEKKFQRADWKKRPLSNEQLRYAQTDTHYLIALRDKFYDDLEAAGCLLEAEEIMKNESKVRLPDRDFKPDGFWKIRDARKLNPKEKAILKAVYVFRDTEAERRDVPPFKVLGNDVLVQLAKAAPRSLDDLSKLKSMSKHVVRRVGEKILPVISEAIEGEPPALPAGKTRVPDDIRERYDRLHLWRKEHAQSRGVPSDVILSRHTMWHIAEMNPDSVEAMATIPTLGPHRLSLHGEAILRAID